MAKCNMCRRTILFGGIKDGPHRYCNDKCKEGHDLAEQNSEITDFAQYIPQDVLDNGINELHMADCPRCHGPGPVDVQTSHYVWSVIVVYFEGESVIFACYRCGKKQKIKYSLLTFIFGWWGLTGIILTPIQIGRNIYGLLRPHDPLIPSAQLIEYVRMNIASEAMAYEKELEDNPDALTAAPQEKVGVGHDQD